ncbi:MAG: ABC transporter permease [Bacilli bacterium]
MNFQVGGVNGAAYSSNVSPAVMQSLIQHYHLNSPWFVQWWFYVQGFVTWHMGTSFEYPGSSTQSIIASAFPFSIRLALMAVATALIIAILLGVIAAVKENGRVDFSAMFVAILGASLPSYVVATLLILILALWLHWLPVIGYTSWQNFVMPVLALAIPMVGSLSRYLRNSLLDSLHSEYITGVIAKGGTVSNVVFGHALRNSLLPLITVVGPILASLMTGTVLIEQMFDLPGLGHIFVNAANTRDYPLIMDSAMLYAMVIMLMNLVVDLTYGILDPRVRRSANFG